MDAIFRSPLVSRAGPRRRSSLFFLITSSIALLIQIPCFCAASPSVKPATSPQEPINRIRQLLLQESWVEAESESRALLASAESIQGKESVLAAQAMDLLVEALIGLGKMGDPEAKSLADRAVEIMEKRFGPESLEVAGALAVSGKLRFFAGDYPGARSVCERASAIQDKTPPRDELDRVPTLDCLGMTYTRLGAMDQARPAFERTIAIQEKALGPEALGLAKPLNHLGILYGMSGQYDKVIPLMKRSIGILEKNLGPENPALGAPLNNLGMLYKLTGNYTEAVPLIERALEIRTQALGPSHFEVGLTTEVLGNLHLALADYARAETYLRSALDIDEHSVGPSHSEVGAVLGELGELLAQQGRLTEAVPLLQRCIETLDKSYGSGHAEPAFFMVQLANVQVKLGQLEPAGELYRKALAIQNQTLGPDHPDRAVGYQGLGSYLLATGDFPQARDLLTKALAINEKVFGEDGFEVSETLQSLALAQWALGDVKTALVTALRSEASIRRLLLRTAPVLSERQALRYESRLGGGISTAASILASRPEMAASPEPAARLWEEVVRSRAVVLDEIARRHQAVLQLEDSETTKMSEDLAQARSQLSHLSLAELDKDHPERTRMMLQRAAAEVETLERQLAAKSRSYRDEETARLAGWDEARQALPAGAALVAYLRFDRLSDPGKSGAASGAKLPSGTPSYAALTFKAGDAAPRFVLLGTAQEIDAKVAAWRREILNPGSEQQDKSYRNAALDLSRKIWDPVATPVHGAHLVFLVPDASLNLVSFATLSRPGNRYLIEEDATLHYLSSERDLLQPPRAPRPAATALVLGGPDFDNPASTDLAAATAAAVPPVAAPRTVSAAYRSSVPSCEAFRTMRFAPLPNTVAEADEVASLLSSKASTLPASGIMKLTGKLASEKSIKDLSAGRAILHIATHGFFLSRDCLDSHPAAGGGAPASSPFLDNPLLFSGLAMAGANLRSGGSAASEDEDGILTAAEVASLDLRGVEWAVLSACETGLGPIQVGEGVLGLRRAFQIAGARTLIMSLWSVSDVPARDWIHNLYASRISGATSAQAVRDATLKMLQARRKAGVSTHPSSWGAFIASGDWR